MGVAVNEGGRGGGKFELEGHINELDLLHGWLER